MTIDAAPQRDKAGRWKHTGGKPPGRGRPEGLPAPCFPNLASIVFYSVLTTFPKRRDAIQ